MYRSDFGGTSAAAAIIAGAALSVQGMAEQNLGHRLTPPQMRELLSDRISARSRRATCCLGELLLNSLV
jgi:hypothetical protein